MSYLRDRPGAFIREPHEPRPLPAYQAERRSASLPDKAGCAAVCGRPEKMIRRLRIRNNFPARGCILNIPLGNCREYTNDQCQVPRPLREQSGRPERSLSNTHAKRTFEGAHCRDRRCRNLRRTRRQIFARRQIAVIRASDAGATVVKTEAEVGGVVSAPQALSLFTQFRTVFSGGDVRWSWRATRSSRQRDRQRISVRYSA